MWLQAASAPHQDVSARETELSQRLCEHLLYRLRRQRLTLRALGAHHTRLTSLSSILADFVAGGPSGLPAQVSTCLWW